MAVPDEATCQSVFVEVCNAKYEATYVLLADLGLLALSADGLTTCAGHLATAACEDQVFDLDGPCAAVWQGLQPDGGACGPGIESFVCGEASHCVLGLDLCGTCEAGAPTFPKSGDAWVGPGETCDADHKCQYKSVCADGVCRETALLGEPCGGGGESGSGSGASCASGVCEDGTCVVDPNPPSLYCLSP